MDIDDLNYEIACLEDDIEAMEMTAKTAEDQNEIDGARNRLFDLMYEVDQLEE